MSSTGLKPLRAPGPRADDVVAQIRCEHLQSRELRQGGGEAPCPGIASAAFGRDEILPLRMTSCSCSVRLGRCNTKGLSCLTHTWDTFGPVVACLDLGALGPRADLVAAQFHSELLELRELRQGRGQALSAFIAWEARATRHRWGTRGQVARVLCTAEIIS